MSTVYIVSFLDWWYSIIYTGTTIMTCDDSPVETGPFSGTWILDQSKIQYVHDNYLQCVMPTHFSDKGRIYIEILDSRQRAERLED